MRCAVYGCRSFNEGKKKSENISFFAFPKDNNLLKQFLHFCRRADKINVKTARICSAHFKEEEDILVSDFLVAYGIPARKRLKTTAVPTQLSPWATNTRTKKRRNGKIKS